MSFKVFAVGVGDYNEIPKIPSCVNDATVFSSILKDRLITPEPILLTDNKVTLSALPRKFKAFCDQLSENDTLIFYYAGHGCNLKEKAYISVIDSESGASAVEDTWIELEVLRGIARSSKVTKILFFIDSCREFISGERSSVLENLEIREAIEIQDKNRYDVILYSCSEGQKAIKHKENMHGVWTYYLIQAFSCSEIGKGALNKNNELKVGRLRDWLFLSVKDYYESKGELFTQEPDGEIKSNVDPLIIIFPEADIQLYEAVPEEKLSQISYETITEKEVRSLDGFKKKKLGQQGHFIPDTLNNRFIEFVQRIADKEIMDVIEFTKDKLVELFELLPDEEIENDGYEFNVSDEGGVASFECKYLLYEVYIDFDEGDPSVMNLVSVLKPRDQNAIYEYREDLDDCFKDWFNKMVFTGKEFSAVDWYKKLKKIEKAQGLPFEMNLLSGQASFEIYLEDGRNVIFHDGRIEISMGGNESLDELLESLADVSNTLVQIDNTTALLD